MVGSLPIPAEIRRLGKRGLLVTWRDGHESEFANDYLRAHCPCALCRERAARDLPPVEGGAAGVYAAQIGVVGRYAVNIQWSDGHDSGIYGYETLRGLCPCGLCESGRQPGAGRGGAPA